MVTLWDEAASYIDIDSRMGFCRWCSRNVRAVEYRQDQHIDEVCAVHLERLGAPLEETCDE